MHRGTQNREAPLRQISQSHFEIKSIDGLSNPYLVVAVLIGVGLQTLLENPSLRLPPNCTVDPATLSADERRGLQITNRLPGSLDEALAALERDHWLIDGVLGRDVIELYLNVKRTEAQLLRAMPEEERRDWLIERF